MGWIFQVTLGWIFLVNNHSWLDINVTQESINHTTTVTIMRILLLLFPFCSSSPIHVAHLAGSVQQVGSTLAAGMAANTQWFQPAGTGM